MIIAIKFHSLIKSRRYHNYVVLQINPSNNGRQQRTYLCGVRVYKSQVGAKRVREKGNN
mgnify:CR=1 FL=1